MTQEKWQIALDTIKSKFEVLQNEMADLGEGVPGQKQVVIFVVPGVGKFKLEFVEKCRLLDEKTIYSNRIGSSVKVEKVYNENDRVCYLNAFKWNDQVDEWEDFKQTAGLF